jgi:hypothetical protein
MTSENKKENKKLFKFSEKLNSNEGGKDPNNTTKDIRKKRIS